MQLTVRHDSPRLAERLKALAEARGESLNATMVSILSAAVGVDERRSRLQRYVSDDDSDARAAIEELAALRAVDDELWR